MEKTESSISIKLPWDMLKQLDYAAGILNKTRNYIIRAALEDYLQKAKETKPLPKGIQRLMEGNTAETEPTEAEKEFLSSFEFNEDDFVPDE